MPELGTEGVLERMERAKENTKWFYDHIEELRKEYLDMFVAIDNQKVIGKHSELNRLISKLKKQYMPLDVLAIEFISEKDIITIL